MSDPIKRLPGAFGKLLTRLRTERQLTQEALAVAAGLRDTATVAKMERGEREPTLTELFRIAAALGIPPAMLFVDVIAAWRTDDILQYSRASDFIRLHRLGYHHKPGDFRELATPYYSVAEAIHTAMNLNATRYTRGVALLDTVCTYVRLTSTNIKREPEVEASGDRV